MLLRLLVKFVLHVFLKAVEPLVVCLDLSYLSFLFKGDLVLELLLDLVEFLYFLIHSYFFISFPFQGFSLKIVDLGIKLFNLGHCVPQAFILLFKGLFILFLYLTEVGVALVSKLINLHSRGLVQFHIKVLRPGYLLLKRVDLAL